METEGVSCKKNQEEKKKKRQKKKQHPLLVSDHNQKKKAEDRIPERQSEGFWFDERVQMDIWYHSGAAVSRGSVEP